MQVILMPTAGPTQLPDNVRELLLPELLRLLDIPPEIRAARDHEAADDREKRLRRRDADARDVASAAAATPRPSDTAIHAERQMLPGSQAARREELSQQAREQAAAGQRDFRQALADAAARSKTERTPAATGHAQDVTSASKARAPESAANTRDQTAPPPPSETDRAPATAARAPSVDATPTAAGAAPRGGFVARPTLLAIPAPASVQNTGTAQTAGKPLTAATVAVRGIAATTPSGGSASHAGGRGTPMGAQAKSDVALAPTTWRATGGVAAKKAAAPASAVPAEDGNSDPNVARITRLLLARVGQNRSVATLRLNPPELGSLRLRLDLRNDQLALQVDAETPAAQRLLFEQLDTLRRSLEASGIQLEHVEVRAPAAVTHEPAQPETPPQPDVWAQHQDGQGRSESESAGGGRAQGTEASPGSPTDAVVREATAEPAAESLVNVLA